ncbi:protein ALP1-like [Cimex lectularius]|uniref:DDE Tnp4 domain-containing protein n=1 Tax=Cimex lectularius TaxID=79782 RepID=A0A8I6RCU7_CIMLE|nr:protein ALP1-like [Cimex lectularius]
MSSSDEEEFLLLFAFVQSTSTRRRFWVHPINQRREELGEYHRLCRELHSHEDRFFSYFRMSRQSFEELHEVLRPRIERITTNWRRPIETRERLAVTLRYLATGDSHQTIAFSFRLGRSTVSKIVREVCREIWNALQPIYLPAPTTQLWKKAEEGFSSLWGFPNCIGSIDGKHIKLKCPKKSGSKFFCYKNHFSQVLLAVVDPLYKFMVVDVGSYGRHSDSAIFENSAFYRQYIYEKTILSPKPLPGTDTPVPHVIVGDEGFALQPYLMRPYPKATMISDSRKKIFNALLSRARRVVENAFGILAMKWRVFLRPIETDESTAEWIVKAACCLHNYIMIKNDGEQHSSNEEMEEVSGPMKALERTLPTNRRSTATAIQIREQFADYFAAR